MQVQKRKRDITTLAELKKEFYFQQNIEKGTTEYQFINKMIKTKFDPNLFKLVHKTELTLQEMYDFGLSRRKDDGWTRDCYDKIVIYLYRTKEYEAWQFISVTLNQLDNVFPLLERVSLQVLAEEGKSRQKHNNQSVQSDNVIQFPNDSLLKRLSKIKNTKKFQSLQKNYQLNATELNILALLDNMNDPKNPNQIIQPSFDYISSLFQISTGTVHNTVHTLENKKLITIKQKGKKLNYKLNYIPKEEESTESKNGFVMYSRDSWNIDVINNFKNLNDMKLYHYFRYYGMRGLESIPVCHSVSRICNDLKWSSRTTFYRALNNLIELKLVEKEEIWKNGRKETCFYKLLLNEE